MQEQNHPLYATDRNHVDVLLTRKSPSDIDLVDLARLLNRYDGFPGANDIKLDLQKVLDLWGLTKDQLNSKTRALWSKGFRPVKKQEEEIGSGFDTSENSSN